MTRARADYDAPRLRVPFPNLFSRNSPNSHRAVPVLGYRRIDFRRRFPPPPETLAYTTFVSLVAPAVPGNCHRIDVRRIIRWYPVVTPFATDHVDDRGPVITLRTAEHPIKEPIVVRPVEYSSPVFLRSRPSRDVTDARSDYQRVAFVLRVFSPNIVRAFFSSSRLLSLYMYIYI